MLTFDELRRVNVHRCIHEFYHPLNAWSVAEWGAATAGECGEACNIAKKLIRIRDGMQGLTINNKTREEYLQELADEIADLVIYSDLWAASEGIDLGEAIKNKFNRDSLLRGKDSRL